MGQCSTLPTAEARNETSNSSQQHYSSQERDDHPTAHHRYRAASSPNMTDASDNSTTPLTLRHKQNHLTRKPHGYQLQVETVQQPNGGNNAGPAEYSHTASPQNHRGYHPGSSPQAVQFNHMQNHAVQPQGHGRPYGHPPQSPLPPISPSSAKPKSHPSPSGASRQTRETTSPVPQPMQEERELPAPPEAAIRTRCYKLNLESDFVGINSADAHGYILGPFSSRSEPPGLAYSASDDSTGTTNATKVAIKTAQIFRGITVGKDGTILSQNARASRSNRGNKTKRGEKSRQAAKIDKAKDLVEETIQTGKAPDSDKAANMVSLVIMGEYDEMRYLVRDGSKKLRDATGLPDEALLSMNRLRSMSAPSLRSPMSPSRKRVSPHVGGGGTGHYSFSSHAKSPSPTKPRLPSSAPPKLKGNPRDRPTSRKFGDNSGRGGRRFLGAQDPCNNMFPPPGGDSDWSGALGFSRGFNSIWNCGGNGTTSPTQYVNKDNKGGYHHPQHHHAHHPQHHQGTPTSQQQQQQQHPVDARHETSSPHHHHQHSTGHFTNVPSSSPRGRPESERMSAPGPHHQAVRA